jgi:hypothetical protein
LERVRAEKERLIKAGKIKRDKNDSAIVRSDDKSHYGQLPPGWAWVKLGAVCDIARGGSPRPIQDYITNNENGINWIKIGDTEQGGKYITKTNEKIKIMQLISGDSSAFDKMIIPMIVGAGFDIGFLYRWDIGLSAGLTFDDIVTRGSVVSAVLGNDKNTYYVPFSMNLGLAYDFKIGTFWKNAPQFFADTGIAVTFDWRDIANTFQQDDYTRRNASLDIGIGLQITMLDMIKVRFGMNEMLPAVGLGVKIKDTVEIEMAYYGKELGLEPGQLSAPAIDLTIAVRPKAKERDWIWTRGSLVGLFSNIANKKGAESSGDTGGYSE